jgi:hypothetical protein
MNIFNLIKPLDSKINQKAHIYFYIKPIIEYLQTILYI